MRVLIAGAGAVGGLLGARLGAANHHVTVWTRTETAVAIQRNGLRVTGRGDVVTHPTVVTEVAREQSYDLVVLTVKAYDVPVVAASLVEHLSPTPILALQNGLGIEEQLRAVIQGSRWPADSHWFERGINTLPAMRIEPGVIRQPGDGEILLPEPAEGNRGFVRSFEELFRSAQVPVRFTKDMEREIWRKVLVNAAINPVTADHRVPNGALVRDPWRGQALALLHEARAVAAKEGVTFSVEEAETDLFRVVRATAENHSSMLQDVERGHPTEIEAISGEILRRGQGSGLALPATERIVGRFRTPGKTS